ncbi:hypothetical protein HK101_000945 [Irineochytrium annulatum]|nr:hypothetical protein HK101_000945 [Irineochytrium annulatum]
MSSKSILIFSGGSAANSFVSMLQGITDNICYVLPVSDDGGSTSEIVKVVGGPGIGDIRSRLVRLAETKTLEAKAVHSLLSYRLPTETPMSLSAPTPAKLEWLTIVEGTHPMWENISQPYRETIRAFLLQFHYKVLKQAGHGPVFDFRGGSIGNFFLTGCRLFFNSLDAAIFQFARITRSPSRTDVLPIVETDRTPIAIAAALRDGSIVVGQCEISHPGSTTATTVPTVSAGGRKIAATLQPFVPSTQGSPVLRRKSVQAASLKNALLAKSVELLSGRDFSSSAPMLALTSAQSSSSNLFFSKITSCPSLAAPIRRIFYINAEQSETFPALNAMAPEHLQTKRTIIYSIGSLYTSIIPCLIVPGVGRLLADEVDLDFTEGEASYEPSPTIKERRASFSSIPPPQSVFTSQRRGSASTFVNLTSRGTNTIALVPSGFKQSSLSSEVFLHRGSVDELKPGASPAPSSTSPALNRDRPVLREEPSVIHERVKVLLLNGTYDRETEGYTAVDFVLAITDALNYSCMAERSQSDAVRRVTTRDVSQDMDDAVHVPRNEDSSSSSTDAYDDGGSSSAGAVAPSRSGGGGEQEGDEEMDSGTGNKYLVRPYPPKAFLTHLVYPEDGEIPVDVAAIEAFGISCHIVRKRGEGDGSVSGRGFYGMDDLRRVLEPLIC